MVHADTPCPFHALFSLLSPFGPPFFRLFRMLSGINLNMSSARKPSLTSPDQVRPSSVWPGHPLHLGNRLSRFSPEWGHRQITEVWLHSCCE